MMKRFKIESIEIKIENRHLNDIKDFYDYLCYILIDSSNKEPYPFEFLFNKSLEKNQYVVIINKSFTHVEYSSTESLKEAINYIRSKIIKKDSKIYLEPSSFSNNSAVFS